MSTLSPSTLFIALFVLVVAWFLLLTLLWRRLISHHPAKYDAMHRPSFLSPMGALSTMRFLVFREHRHLGDRALGLTADTALVVLLLNVAGFVLLAVITGAFT